MIAVRHLRRSQAPAQHIFPERNVPPRDVTVEVGKQTAPALHEKLWHSMRADLARYAPQIADNDRLMCCCCGRFLPKSYFDLEHIIPQIAVGDEPLLPAKLYEGRTGRVVVDRLFAPHPVEPLMTLVATMA